MFISKKRIEREKQQEKELEKVREMFSMQDYAKDLLFNVTTKTQEESARKFLTRIDNELKMLYIPTPIENV